MSNSGIVTVYVTFKDATEAESIGRTTIEERLAACINILGQTQSVYRWRGRVETATECAAMLKTTAIFAEALVRRIAELHSYDNPCIAVWPIDSAPDPYVRWVRTQMR